VRPGNNVLGNVCFAPNTYASAEGLDIVVVVWSNGNCNYTILCSRVWSEDLGVIECLWFVQCLSSLLLFFLNTVLPLWCKGTMVCWDHILNRVSKQLLG